MGDRVRRRATVHGEVQGVFFRDSVRDQAQRRGVAGWARNRPDGAVEIVLEGPPEAVQEVLQFCESGPPDASVERAEVQEESPEGLSDFSTR